MTLRTGLLLGYSYLVALVLLAAGSAVFGFLHLSAGIDRVLDENYQSIQAAMSMLESLERQDSQTLSSMIDAEPEEVAMEGLEAEFQEALSSARRNLTEEAEIEPLERITATFAAYRQARDTLIRQPSPEPLAAYNDLVFPAFSAVKREVRGLLDINQDAMVAADRAARTTALRSSAWLGFLVAVALFSTVILARVMHRRLLLPLARLQHGLERMAAGEEIRRLHGEGTGELPAVAAAVNSLLDRYQGQRGVLEARLAQERRTLLGLLGAFGEGAALYDLGGRLRGGDGPSSEVAGWIREEGRRRIEGGELEIRERKGDREIRLLCLGEHPAGWLAVPATGLETGE